MKTLCTHNFQFSTVNLKGMISAPDARETSEHNVIPEHFCALYIKGLSDWWIWDFQCLWNSPKYSQYSVKLINETRARAYYGMGHFFGLRAWTYILLSFVSWGLEMYSFIKFYYFTHSSTWHWPLWLLPLRVIIQFVNAWHIQSWNCIIFLFWKCFKITDFLLLTICKTLKT